jgi:hypothetical protein
VTNAIQNEMHLGLDNAVVDVGAVTAGLHDVAPPHLGQVLGNDGLVETQAFLDLPNRLLFLFQEFQDPEAVRVPHHLDDISGLVQCARIDGSDQILVRHGRYDNSDNTMRQWPWGFQP